MSTPFSAWRWRVLGAAGQCGHRDTGGVHLVDDVRGRRAQRVGDQFDRVLERHLDVTAGHRVQPAQHALAARLVLRQRRHTEVGQRLGDEIAVRLRDQLVDVDRRALGGHLGGHHDVDAVRLAVGVGVHPLQNALEIVGVVEPDAAEHAEAARAADGGGHLLRRGEDEDRVSDPEPFAEFGTHQVFTATCLACTSSAGRSSVWSLAHR